jgi:hypothetical protein
MAYPTLSHSEELASSAPRTYEEIFPVMGKLSVWVIGVEWGVQGMKSYCNTQVLVVHKM